MLSTRICTITSYGEEEQRRAHLRTGTQRQVMQVDILHTRHQCQLCERDQRLIGNVNR